MCPVRAEHSIVERVVTAPWVQKAKVRNTSNTHSHEHTRSSTYPLTNRPHPPTQSRTDAPTYPPTTCYSNTAKHSSRCVDTIRVDALGFPFSTILRHLGERVIRARESLSTPPARRGGHRRPFFRHRVRGLLCWEGVAPRRGRARPSGSRKSQLVFGYSITGMFSKIHLDITTTTEEQYIIWITRRIN